ncbi:Rab family GTPase [Saccharomycopsis crataegensis]|uniref:Rab family GTPase n=1 Tax=Saccharomycopsis crataegensis TaxID=43959 RepID=A0AAV5QQD0_9ASCO|nr:Rab family GTPase [Saccharomycopsis crataegensis]
MSEYTKRFGAFKLVFLGESAVGKSSIIQRFTRNIFDEYQNATIGAAFISRIFEFRDDANKVINKVKYEIWDTAGQERYKSLTPMYYRNANVAVIVFDLTEKSSFTRAKDWISELQLYCDGANIRIMSGDDEEQTNDDAKSNSLLMILVGNKLDLIKKDGQERAVSNEELSQFVDEHKFVYIETSAKSGENIKNLFETSIATSLPSHMFTVEGGKQKKTQDSTGNYNIDLNEGLNRNLATESSQCAC